MQSKEKYKIVLVQLGSPRGPAPGQIREFLKNFLGDPRVVDLYAPLWKIILYTTVLPFRPRILTKAYGKIWNGKSFPLIELTENFAHLVQENLGEDFQVEVCFLLSSPTWKDVWAKGEGERAEKVLILPQFPQYAEATTASVADSLLKSLEARVVVPSFEFVGHYHRLRAYIDHSIRKIEETLKAGGVGPEANEDHLIISFHGMPVRRIVEKGDPYYQQCLETFHLIKNGVRGISSTNIHLTFQSRFGSEEWLSPYTETFILEGTRQGWKRIFVYCPSFVADCLETLVEIGEDIREKVVQGGGELHLVPCLNDDPLWAKDYAHYIETTVLGTAEEKKHLHYEFKEEIKMTVKKESLSPAQMKSTFKILFLTLFLDLIGFTIIFPMFPSMAEYYLRVDAQDPFLRAIFSLINEWGSLAGNQGAFKAVVLFGGILGALYSLFQFLFAPFWGKLSDRIGRRPVLLFSLTGIMLGHLIWIFSGSFSLLLLSRLLGGIMSGNISTATAVVADVTTRENRSKGMAVIGIAFALGFIIGPAIGGILSLWDLTQTFPELASWGINPFSVPAIFSFILAVINLFFLVTSFKETLPQGTRQNSSLPSTQRSANPFYLFRPFPFHGVNLTNLGHFTFLVCFSGMEFTLTFLAVERLHHTSLQNAYMFIYIGVLIVLIQGGVVRRRAHQVGEKKMSLMGLALLIPGLFVLGFAESTWTLYFGLSFLAVGAAMVIPCMTTLISLYTPLEVQGQVIGVFRSLGALARVIGPVLASVIYWRWGSAYPYVLGALFLMIPLWMVSRLPRPAFPSSPH